MNVNTEHDPFEEIKLGLDNPPLDWDPRGVLKDDDHTYRERRVVGVVEERETLVGVQDKTYERLIVVLRNSATRVSVRCWATVLKSKVAQRDPRPGDMIGVEYLGSKPNSDPKLGDIELYDLVKAGPSVESVESVESATASDESDTDEPPLVEPEPDDSLPMPEEGGDATR